MKKLIMAAMLACGATYGAQLDSKVFVGAEGWAVSDVVVHIATGDTVATILNGKLKPGEGMDGKGGIWFDGRVDDAFDDGIFITCDSEMNILEIIGY